MSDARATAGAVTISVATAEEMRRLGRVIGTRLRPGDVLLLHGDLGAGKTTLAQGVAAALGISEAMQSPTFTLVAEHQGRLPAGTPVRVNHLDLYRLTGPEELESFGYEQYLDAGEEITLIEWPERAADWQPDAYFLAAIVYAPPGRQVTLTAQPPQAQADRFDTIVNALRHSGFGPNERGR